MPSSRSWWSRSKPGSGISLHSIASAIGLKSKKHRPRSLTIQDPPVFPSTSTPDRPSPARSRVDSTGPPTPVDECRSLPTFSDNDPFAGRQNVPPVPQIHSKNTPFEDITSCASSLSSSNNQVCDAPTLSPTTGLLESRKLPTKRSITFSRSPGCTDTFTSPPSLTSKRPGSSSTAVADTQTHLRPKLRPRGMTDSGSTKKSGFFLDERSHSKKLSQKLSTSTFSTAMSSTEPTSPHAVIRRTSLNRLIAPPCAPPAHSLPATPTNASSPIIARTASSSPSCISFASSSSNEMLPALCYSLREKGCSEPQDHNPDILSTPTKESKTTPSSPRKLKKPLSQQSLSGKSNVQPPTLPKLSPDKMIDKVFRKHKTPHHIRSPMPPISNPLSPPSPIKFTTFPSLPDLGSKTLSGSGNCSLGRKKIRSHSSITTQPSASHYTTTMTKDDSLSVFSLRSDPSSHLKPWASPKAAPQSSFWDEPGSPVISSSTRSTSEYTPQPILSAAQVAKLEASIENSPDRSSRSRMFSLRSSTALDMENLDFTPAGLSPPPTPKLRSKPGSLRSTSKTPTRARSPRRSPPPSINGNPDNDSGSTIRFQPFASGSPAELATSLPPPPRSRQRRLLVSHPEHPNPSPLFSSSVFQSSRSKPSVEKNMQCRSVTKKPSFLEIDDDTDQDDLFSGETTTDSFLDLAGESCEDSGNDP